MYIDKIELDVGPLSPWSYNNNLIFNYYKVWLILFVISQMSLPHVLKNYSLLTRCSEKSIPQKLTLVSSLTNNFLGVSK